MITMPSAKPSARPRLYVRMACDSAGVGVYPPALSIIVSTALAASTSKALTQAGSESACVSMARNSGPLIPSCLRYWQMACVMARIWDSLNDSVDDDPRCPDVPNATRCARTPGSGRAV